jgi:uncharacterized protein (TIGR03437 family)
MVADAAGNVYFPLLNSIVKLDPNGIVTRVAGNGRSGDSDDGGPAIEAQISPVGSLAVDTLGNLYIGEAGRIRRVSTKGIITTIAGIGAPCQSGQNSCGFSGDRGPAASAVLSFAPSMAVDGAGDLFIAEANSGVVRKVGADGVITTVAGNGTCCVTPSSPSGDGGPALNAILAPVAVAVDNAGNLFIGEPNHIRKVSPDGIISTFAGTDASCSNLSPADCLGDDGPAIKAHLHPTALVFDSAGNLLVADSGYQRVRRISPNGTITTVAGINLPGPNNQSGSYGDGGPATSARFSFIRGLAIDGAGNFFISDQGSGRLRKVTLDGIINTVAGGGDFRCCFSGDNGPGTSALLSAPWDVAADESGNVFIADYGNNRVRKMAPDGTITTVAGNGSAECFYAQPGQTCPPIQDGGPATSTVVNVQSIAVDGSGNVFIAGGYDNRVRKVAQDGTITTVAGNGLCCHSGDGGKATDAQLTNAMRVTADREGNLFISEVALVREVLANGEIGSVAGNGKDGFSGDGGPAKDAQLNIADSFDDCGPYGAGLAVDSAGDLFIADSDNGRVREVTAANGIINTVAGIGPCFGGCAAAQGIGDGGLSTNAYVSPAAVALDSAGNLFIADTNRIRRVSRDGTITTIGGGTHGYSGDGGPATGAALNYPEGIALDGSGNIYVADTNNNAVRVLRPAKSSVLIGSIVDAASQRIGPVSPGKIVVIYGAGLGPPKLGTGNSAGTAVSFNGVLAQILYASATQVAAVVPASITGTTAEVAVNYLGTLSEPAFVPVAPSSPGLFTLSQTGAGQAAAVNQDGTTNSAVKPANRGGYISLYATGWSDPKLPVSLTIDGIQAPIQFAGQAPGQPSGLMQVNVQIPRDAMPGGYVPVVLKVGDASTVDGAVWIAVGGN